MSLPGRERTVAELLEKYVSDYAESQQSKGTVEWVRFIVCELKEFFGPLLVTELTPDPIQSYRNGCRERGLAPSTSNHRLGILRHAFNLAIREWGWLRENPVVKVRREKVRNARDRWLTLEEEERLFEACLPEPGSDASTQTFRLWLAQIIFFALQTGMRQDEILSLEWSEVDLFRRTVTILKSKNGEKRTIPLNQKRQDY